MASKICLASIILLSGLSAPVITWGQTATNHSNLIGRWQAIYPAKKLVLDGSNGKSVSIKVAETSSTTLVFKPNKQAILSSTAKVNTFTYRLINSKVIAFDYLGEKPKLQFFTIVKNKLHFSPYPVSKVPQESIDLFYELTFIKQP